MKTGALLLLFALASCDNSQAFHTPEPTLSRMLSQRRADPFEATTAFSDGKVMRRPSPGVVATDDDRDDPPPEPSPELLALGRRRFDVTCATCHGLEGDGESVVATKMQHRRPASFHTPRSRALSRHQIFTIATAGYGLMPGYSDVLSTRERWAVAFYAQALQLRHAARAADLPEALKAELAKEAP